MTRAIQKYYVLIVLILGAVFMAILYLRSMYARAWYLMKPDPFGWGGIEVDRYSFYQNHSYFVMWILVFPLAHWMIYKFKRTINENIEFFQIFCIFLIIQDLINQNTPIFYLNVLLWLLFVLAVLLSFKKEWNQNESNKNEDILDAK